jgi:hypothetical protein
VSTDLSEQRVRLRLAGRTGHYKVRKRPHRLLKPLQFVGSPVSLLQQADFTRIEHELIGYSRPQPFTGSSQTSRRPLSGHTNILSSPCPKNDLEHPGIKMARLAGRCPSREKNAEFSSRFFFTKYFAEVRRIGMVLRFAECL